QPLDVLGTHVWVVEIERKRPARRRVNQRKHQQRNEEQQRHALRRPPRNETQRVHYFTISHSYTFQNGPAFVGLPLKLRSVAGTASICEVLYSGISGASSATRCCEERRSAPRLAWSTVRSDA